MAPPHPHVVRRSALRLDKFRPLLFMLYALMADARQHPQPSITSLSFLPSAPSARQASVHNDAAARRARQTIFAARQPDVERIGRRAGASR